MLDTVVAEMQDDLIRMRQTSAQVLATQRMLEAKYRGATLSADDWQRRAELAVRAGNDELAREALRRKKAFSDLAATQEGQLIQHTRATDSLMGSIRVMESKLTEAKGKKETLKARAKSAEASMMVNEQLGGMLSGLRSSTNSSLAAFAAMEEKVMALEAEAEGAAMMMPIGDVLEGRFAMLEGGVIGVDDELNKMKQAMGGTFKTDSRLSDVLSESGYINIKVR